MRRIAGGASLYSRDIVEINLPLIVQISQLAVWLSDVTGIQAMNAWRILVSLVLVLSLLVSIELLRKALGKGGADLRAPLAAMFAFVFACLPNYDFGQREHLLVMAFTPYVLAAGLRCVRLEPTRAISILVGVLLAAAMCLKPHYVVALLLVELCVVCYRKTVVVLWRTELITAAVVLMAYVIHMVISYPGFFAQAIPLAAQYYARI